MGKLLFVHGMRMQGEDPGRLRDRWNEKLTKLLEATPWGKANPDAAKDWGQADLAYWADLFRWADGVPPLEATKDIDIETSERQKVERGRGGSARILKQFYKIPRLALLGVDAAATFSAQEGRPTNLIAQFCDSRVVQTAVYMNNGPVFGSDPAFIEKHRDFFGPDRANFYAPELPERGAYFEVQARIDRFLTDDVRVVIAHSLGTAIAYEALCRRKHRVHTFITIGSPMATPELILQPLKRRLARLSRHDESLPLPWPNVRTWTNFCAPADAVIVPIPELQSAVHPDIRDVSVVHGSVYTPNKTHLLLAYLEHPEIGDAVAEAIEGSIVEDRKPLLGPTGAREASTPKGIRYFGAIGVGAPARMPPLREVPHDVTRMRDVFEEGLGYRRIPFTDNPTVNDLRADLEGWLTTTTFGPDDSVVLYYSGHGYIERGAHYLCTRDFRTDAIGGAFRSRELVDVLLRRAGAPRKLWVLLDCCQAGDALRDLADEMQRQHGEHYALVASASYGLAFDGAFTKAFVSAAANRERAGQSFNEFAGAIDDRLREGKLHAAVRKLEPSVSSAFDFLDGLAVRKLAPLRPRKRVRVGPWIGAAVFVLLLVGAGLGLRPLLDRRASRESVAIAPGMARLGTDGTTARQTYLSCVSAEGSTCGASYEASVFVRQVAWSEAPTVIVNSFELDAHEVTRGEFATWLDDSRAQLASGPGQPNTMIVRDPLGLPLATVDAGGEGRIGVSFSGGRYAAKAPSDATPVTHVSWYGANAFCAARGKRLPTETEWEFAARGPNARSFPWGEQPPPATGVAYAVHPCEDDRCAPIEVGRSPYDKTPEGVFDLAGNVTEWTASSFAGESSEERARCESRNCRVARGGNYRDSAAWLHAAIRGRFEAAQALDNVGFRCAKDG